jgi:uncharacterized membrane protein YedE/YeeE
MEVLAKPWPWYIAGPLIGLMVPLLLLIDNRTFGLSSSFQHVCAAVFPGRSTYFAYDWKTTGRWNLALALGTLLGGMLAATFLANPEPIAISDATRADLEALGLTAFTGLVPGELFSWSSLGTSRGLILLVGGGFLVGFGARYAGGCTSGHAIFGLSDAQLPSLIAVLGFFAGGLTSTHFLLPWIL